MELPPELLQIVREFSKPVFAHWKIFNDAKKMYDQHHWPHIRKALLGPNHAQVCDEFETYRSLRHLTKGCKESLCAYELSIGIRRHPIYGSMFEGSDCPPQTSDQKIMLVDEIGKYIKAQKKEASQYRKVLSCLYGDSAYDFIRN
jgi:hypothetical protein